MATRISSVPGQDPHRSATPTTPSAQTENTVDAATDAQNQTAATQVDRMDTQAQQREASKSDPAHDTSELPVPDVQDPPIDDAAPHGETLEAIPSSASPQTEVRIERELHRVEETGVVAPRSVIAPAKPAREPNEDEQRMAEDFDPPPLAHRPELGR